VTTNRPRLEGASVPNMRLDTASVSSAVRARALRRGVEAAKQCASIARMASRGKMDVAGGLHYIVDRSGATFSEHPSQRNVETTWVSADVPNDLSRMSVLSGLDAIKVVAELSTRHPERAPFTAVSVWDHALGLAQRWAEMLVLQPGECERGGGLDPITRERSLDRLQVGTRAGTEGASGAHFKTWRSSICFESLDIAGQTQLFDLSALRIADTSAPEVCIEVVATTMRDASVGAELRMRLSAVLSSALEGEPHVDQALADATPIAKAAQQLGYDAVLVRESADSPMPSSLFVWSVEKVRALDEQQSQVVRASVDRAATTNVPASEEVGGETPSP